METKHTPGPWTAGRLPLTDSPIVRDGCGCPVAKPGRDVIAAPGSVADLQDFANARLIAASPKLLEVCISLVNNMAVPCRSIIDLRQITANAKAAIAKATGEVQP